MMSTSTVGTLIGQMVTDLTSIIYGVLPQILTAVAILMGITIGVRYVRHWIFRSAR